MLAVFLLLMSCSSKTRQNDTEAILVQNETDKALNNSVKKIDGAVKKIAKNQVVLTKNQKGVHGQSTNNKDRIDQLAKKQRILLQGLQKQNERLIKRMNTLSK